MLYIPETFILFTGAVGFAIGSSFGAAVGIALGAFLILVNTAYQISKQ